MVFFLLGLEKCKFMVAVWFFSKCRRAEGGGAGETKANIFLLHYAQTIRNKATIFDDYFLRGWRIFGLL